MVLVEEGPLDGVLVGQAQLEVYLGVEVLEGSHDMVLVLWEAWDEVGDWDTQKLND